MGVKKTEEEKMTSTQNYLLESKAYEIRVNLSCGRDLAPMISWFVQNIIHGEKFREASDRTSSYLPPERPPEADDQYKGYPEDSVNELKHWRWLRTELYLRRRGLVLRFLNWLVFWCLCPGPWKLKRLVNKDPIHESPLQEEWGD